MATTLEKTRTHFNSDVFAAVASSLLKLPSTESDCFGPSKNLMLRVQVF